jgi:hypothetical protein
MQPADRGHGPSADDVAATRVWLGTYALVFGAALLILAVRLRQRRAPVLAGPP